MVTSVSVDGLTGGAAAPAVVPARAVPRASRVRWHWLYDARTDVALSWCWVPFFLVGISLGARDAALAQLLTAVLVISLLHQPLTLLLVYGDRTQFRMRRRLFTWAPPIAVVVLVIGVGLNLWVIVPIAAIWNAVHTLQQRYGLLRIHARKSGYGNPRLDRAVVFVPFTAVVVVAAVLPATAHQIDRLSAQIGGGQNADAARQLVAARPTLVVLSVPLVLAAIAVLIAYARQERQALLRGEADAGKWVYLAGTLTLIGCACVNPAAGLVAYIAAHAIEYGIIVVRTMRSKYETRPGRDNSGVGALGFLASSRRRRTALIVAFLAPIALLDVWSRNVLSPDVYLSAIYSIGLLHFLYDAVIWKTRRPAVAASFGVRAAVSGSTPSP
jgi:hypothetical protein